MKFVIESYYRGTSAHPPGRDAGVFVPFCSEKAAQKYLDRFIYGLSQHDKLWVSDLDFRIEKYRFGRQT